MTLYHATQQSGAAPDRHRLARTSEIRAIGLTQLSPINYLPHPTKHTKQQDTSFFFNQSTFSRGLVLTGNVKRFFLNKKKFPNLKKCELIKMFDVNWLITKMKECLGPGGSGGVVWGESVMLVDSDDQWWWWCSVSRPSPACPPLHFPANLKHNKRPFYSTKQSIQSHHIFSLKFAKSTDKSAGNGWGKAGGAWARICGTEGSTYSVFLCVL